MLNLLDDIILDARKRASAKDRKKIYELEDYLGKLTNLN